MRARIVSTPSHRSAAAFRRSGREPVTHQRHYIVLNVLSLDPSAKLNNCHEKAETGWFAYGEIVVPGVSKVVRPGGMF